MKEKLKENFKYFLIGIKRAGSLWWVALAAVWLWFCYAIIGILFY